MKSSKQQEKISFSIIIPVHNEEKFLPLCLSRIEEAKREVGEKAECIVVLNRCTDDSEKIARAAGCIVVNNDQKNLSAIRNSGIQAASGEVIITIDADSLMSVNTLKKIKNVMETERYIGGGVLILPERWSVGIFLTMLLLQPFFLFWRISCGLFFGRREDVLAIGGFDENKFSAEDIDFARRLKAYGKTQQLQFKNLLSAHIVTSCRKFDHFGDWYALKRPLLMLKLLKGNKSKEADRIWYDFLS